MLDGTVIGTISTGERRRRWSAAEKLRMVGETPESGSRISDVAARHDVSASLLHGWQHQVRRGLLCPDGAAGFVAVRMLASVQAGRQERGVGASIEVTLPDGVHVSIRGGGSLPTLRAVIAALRG